MKIIIALVTTIEGEPDIEACFVQGYESAGGEFTGEIYILENIEEGTPYEDVFEYAKNNGYEMVITNQGINEVTINNISKYYNQGILAVIPAGSNNYQDLLVSEKTHAIRTGAGNEFNATAYEVDFFDKDPFYLFGGITNISQLTPEKVLVETDTDGLFVDGLNAFWVELSGITGFANNYNGMVRIVDGLSVYPSGDKFTFTGSLGAGTYGEEGEFRQDFSSYSTPYIAGKMAYIKDQINCSWWEVRYRMQKSSSRNGIYDTYDGWGIPDAGDAINFSGILPLDPYDTLGDEPLVLETQIAGESFYLKMNPILNAEYYRLYNKSELILQTEDVGNWILMSTPRKLKHEGLYQFYYRAYRGSNQESFKSNIINYKNYKYPKLKIANGQE